MATPEDTCTWLLTSPDPWVGYGVRRDLLGMPRDTPEARVWYNRMGADERVTKLIENAFAWVECAGAALKNGELPHVLTVLADFGLERDDGRIEALGESLLASAFGDRSLSDLHADRADRQAWEEVRQVAGYAYCLAKFGFGTDPRLLRAVKHLTALQRLDGGWVAEERVTAAVQASNFAPSCPASTLSVLRALSTISGGKGEATNRAAAYLLARWEQRSPPRSPSEEERLASRMCIQYPWQEGRLLDAVDTFVGIQLARFDVRFVSLMRHLVAKRREGVWYAELQCPVRLAFELSEPGRPSAWLTLVAARALRRAKMWDV